jgi:Xaa-Pro aminopeptidase
MLQPQYAKLRQGRLMQALQQQSLDAVVISDPRHVYYFTTFPTHWLHQSCFVLLADGRSWLLTGNLPATDAVADQNDVYDAQWNATHRSDQPAVVASLAIQYLQSHHAKRIGLDASFVSSQLALSSALACQPIDPSLFEMRRRKDPDELALIRKAIRCTEAMYRRAKEIIEPEVPELTVFTELQKAAVFEAGELLSPQHLGNDYAAGKGGGPPRGNTFAQAGQIYVLDLGPAYRGYFADNCRAFSVDRKPTDIQLRTWQGITQCFPIVESLARPGVKCRDIYAAVDDHFKSFFGVSQKHHLGHGIGLQPHEAPHLNPRWDDTLQEGEVFTAEPGIYGVEINGGIRIEQDYLVTNNGVECLIDFPLELV